MKRYQGFKFALIPSAEQAQKMRCFAGACRYIYNKALALQKSSYEQAGKQLDYLELARLFTQWRNNEDTAWLAESPARALRQEIRHLEHAYTNFFAGRARYPKFRKKGRSDRITYPDNIKLDQDARRIYLPKLGWLRLRLSRLVPGKVKRATVSNSGGKWFVSILTERNVEQPVPQSTTAIGIDVGTRRFATLSDGTIYKPINSFKRHETALRKAQQAMSRKVKFSGNWKRAKVRIQRINARITNARRDYLHKTSTAISKNHALICVEDLKVSNMMNSPFTKTAKNRRQMNRAILDKGWYEFRRMLQYKQDWSGGLLVAVKPQYTSRTCPNCGHISADNRKSPAKFLCVKCGHKQHADVVAAINILRAGHAQFACEVSGAAMPPAAGTHHVGCQIKFARQKQQENDAWI